MQAVERVCLNGRAKDALAVRACVRKALAGSDQGVLMAPYDKKDPLNNGL